MEPEEPTGWFIAHHRASGSPSCYFGPFKTLEDAHAWGEANPEVRGGIIPMYLTVDWNRR